MLYRKTTMQRHPVNLCANALALALVAGLPLFMPNGYVKLPEEKFRYLWACVAMGAVVLAAAFVVGRGLRRNRRQFELSWLWPVGLCLCYTVAWLFAEDRYTALCGISQRKNGLMLYLACTAAFLMIAVLSGRELADAVEKTLLATGCAVTALSWMNDWMLDPLDAYYTFLPETGDRFLGTIGNINFFGAFLCLCVPFAVWRYLYGPKSGMAGRYAVALLLCSGLIAAGSDAAWLGCAAAVFLICQNKKTITRTLSRLFGLGAGLALWGLGIGLLTNFFPLRSELRTLSALLCMPAAALVLAVAFAMAAWGLHRVRERPAALAVRVAGGIAVAAAAAAFLAANLLPECPGFLTALHFDEGWAANRGYAWQRLWVVYTEDTTLFQKLFGLGGDAVAQRLNPDLESTYYMILLNGETFDSAHNEFLQHLVCGGVFGLVCWCGFLAAAVWKGLKNNPPLGAAVAAYAVQSFFSISMPGVFPLVFVLAALAGESRKPSGSVKELVPCTALIAFSAAFLLNFF